MVQVIRSKRCLKNWGSVTKPRERYKGKKYQAKTTNAKAARVSQAIKTIPSGNA